VKIRHQNIDTRGFKKGLTFKVRIRLLDVAIELHSPAPQTTNRFRITSDTATQETGQGARQPPQCAEPGFAFVQRKHGVHLGKLLARCHRHTTQTAQHTTDNTQTGQGRSIHRSQIERRRRKAELKLGDQWIGLPFRVHNANLGSGKRSPDVSREEENPVASPAFDQSRVNVSLKAPSDTSFSSELGAASKERRPYQRASAVSSQPGVRCATRNRSRQKSLRKEVI
jgi:hypothetical protein